VQHPADRVPAAGADDEQVARLVGRRLPSDPFTPTTIRRTAATMLRLLT
jgi:hypothetical protein